MTRQRSSATLTDAESLASTIITETSLRLSARLRTYGRLDEVPISVTVMVPLSFAFSLYTPHLSRYIVPAADGGNMTRSAFTRLWNSHVAALVPFSLHPHMLRHTYATTLYRAGVDLRTAQKLMGHSSIQVTADIYTHLEQEDSLHVADKLNEYLSGKSENSAKSSQKVVKLAI